MPCLDDAGLTQLWSGLKTRFARIGHKHGQSDIEGLAGELAGKAAATHGHEQSQITGLSTALAGKAETSHSHTQSQVTGLEADLAGKAAAAHSHTQSQVTGLADALNMKMPVQTVYYNGDDYDISGKGNLDTMTDALALVPIGVGRNEALFTALGGGGFAYVMQLFYTFPSATARRAQIAMSYDTSIPHMAIRSYTASGWQPWRRTLQTGDGIATYIQEVRITIPKTGWTYDGSYDRYRQDFSASGVKSGDNLYVYTYVGGANCPLIGVGSYKDGQITVFMADTPTVVDTLYIRVFRF